VRRQGRSRLHLANQESMRRLNFGKSFAGIFSALTVAIFAYQMNNWKAEWRGLQPARVGPYSAGVPSAVFALRCDS